MLSIKAKMKPKCTVLGSCRQYTLRNFLDCNELQETLTYAHYSKEVLQMVKYALTGHLPSSIASQLLRSTLVEHKSIEWNPAWADMIRSSDIFFVEIASSKCYEYNDGQTIAYAHHIAIEEQRFFANPSIQQYIKVRDQTKEELEDDIRELKKLLGDKPIVIVSHYSSYARGKRYELVCWLRDICEKANIPFINPKEELAMFQTEDLWVKEQVLSHYTPFGEKQIEKVYRRVVGDVLKNRFFSNNNK